MELDPNFYFSGKNKSEVFDNLKKKKKKSNFFTILDRCFCFIEKIQCDISIEP